MGGSLVAVVERVRIDDTTFLKTRDGGHWVFDSKKGNQMMQGPMNVEVLEPGTMAWVTSEGNLSCSPTVQKWAVTKERLLERARVQVQLIFRQGAAQWAFVSKAGGSIEGWMPCEHLNFDNAGVAAAQHAAGSAGGAFTADQVRSAWNAPLLTQGD